MKFDFQLFLLLFFHYRLLLINNFLSGYKKRYIENINLFVK